MDLRTLIYNIGARANDVETAIANLTNGYSSRVLKSWKDKNQFANIQIIENATLDYLTSGLIESYEQDQEYTLAGIQKSPPWGLGTSLKVHIN